MTSLSIIIFIYMSQINPEYDYHIENVTTVEQALTNIKEMYPYWNQSYTMHEFDCSEMSAFVYSYLKACGLQPEYKCGSNKEIMGPYWHMWIECDGEIIECLGLNTVEPIRAWYDNLTPEDPSKVGEEELDWWNSPQMCVPSTLLEVN